MSRPHGKITLADIAGRGSESFRRLNVHVLGTAAHSLGGLPTSVPESDPVDAHEGAHGGKKGSKARVGGSHRARDCDGQGRSAGGGPRLRVHLIAFRRPGRELDDDNLRGGCKHLRDTIADYFGLDDTERCIAWEYSQCETRGREGVGVKIEQMEVKS